MQKRAWKAEQRAAATSVAAERLVDLTLVTPSGEGELIVHAWVAEALAQYQGEELADRHFARERDVLPHIVVQTQLSLLD